MERKTQIVWIYQNENEKDEHFQGYFRNSWNENANVEHFLGYYQNFSNSQNENEKTGSSSVDNLH